MAHRAGIVAVHAHADGFAARPLVVVKGVLRHDGVGRPLEEPTEERAAATEETVALRHHSARDVLAMTALEHGPELRVCGKITDLITAQRAYEMNSKVISAADEMLQISSQMS